jgi:magnesium chelatase family protein
MTMGPFRPPAHPISDVGRISGEQVAMPSKVSQAHHGVIFLDAFPEFRLHVLELLQQPLGDEMVTIAHVSMGASSLIRLTLPAHLCM